MPCATVTLAMRFAVALCLATAHAALLSPSLSARSGARPLLRSCMLSMEEQPAAAAEQPAPAAFVPLPEGIAARVSFQTGGYKQAGQEEEIQILWNTFSACYPTLEQAEVAVNRNSAVILPNVRTELSRLLRQHAPIFFLFQLIWTHVSFRFSRS